MKYFQKKDFECKCGCGKTVTEHLMKLADELREHVGCPCIITSGRRCDKHNKAVGGAVNSHHKSGNAIDIRAHPNDKEINKKIFNYIKDNKDFCELINEYNYSWVHIALVNGRNDEKKIKKIC